MDRNQEAFRHPARKRALKTTNWALATVLGPVAHHGLLGGCCGVAEVQLDAVHQVDPLVQSPAGELDAVACWE